ncbi:MAG: GntR family transcriptional regulator, rspAB operon transcriptional repressor [Pseudonocardiales bacterium]|jgi:DNA-binding GntR family transcriptional regulator|nr:GntR family transcriptional regulator, rspAB operon transcriptional repressor [Pseudonocardiales bacterium]
MRGKVAVANDEPRASDRAYDALRDRILDLRLRPGSVVNEQALANELELGRMPVREALARLATDRFITVLPRRGAVVTPVSLDDVFDMFEAREAIECGVVHIVAKRAAKEDLATLRRLVEAADRAREGTDHEAFLRDDHAIHILLVHMVRNPLLQDAADRLLLHNLRFWRTYWASRPAQHATMISHADLVSALDAHDPELAEKAMREHLAASRQLLQASF